MNNIEVHRNSEITYPKQKANFSKIQKDSRCIYKYICFIGRTYTYAYLYMYINYGPEVGPRALPLKKSGVCLGSTTQGLADALYFSQP